jgi:6-phosphofructokinase 1
VGQKAVQIAVEDGSGYMSTILRTEAAHTSGALYQVRYDKVPLDIVANSERTFPESWIADSRTDVTDAFVNYARPLIGDDWPSIPLIDGRQRFTQFEKIFAEKQLATYVPQAYRA